MMSKKQKRALRQALELDGNMRAASARAGVTYDRVRYACRSEPFAEARRRGELRRRELAVAERERELKACAARVEQATAAVLTAQLTLGRELARLSFGEVRDADLRLGVLQERAKHEQGILKMVQKKAGLGR